MRTIPKVFRLLSRSLDDLLSRRNQFCLHPGTDFTRSRKLPLRSLLLFLISMDDKSLRDELVQFFHLPSSTPSRSAVVQQRKKLSPLALACLLRSFNHYSHRLHLQSTRWGFHLVACDGSDITSVAHPQDADSFFHVTSHKIGYNMLHVSTVFDLCTHQFLDALIHSKRVANERNDLLALVDRLSLPRNTVWIADRGYESFAVLFRMQTQHRYYVIRAQDIHENGVLCRLSGIPEQGECDVRLSFSLTAKRTLAKQDPVHFHAFKDVKVIPGWDPVNRPFLSLSFRVIRYEDKGNWYVLLTNLPKAKASTTVVKQMYQLRWDIEKAYRDTKYPVALKALHAKKTEFVQQEIYAKLLLYNICKLIQQLLESASAPASHPTRYRYQLNFTHLVRAIRHYIRFPDRQTLSDVMASIMSQRIPVRPGRHSKRGPISYGPVPLNYR
jgi:hypothetical protein